MTNTTAPFTSTPLPAHGMTELQRTIWVMVTSKAQVTTAIGLVDVEQIRGTMTALPNGLVAYVLNLRGAGRAGVSLVGYTADMTGVPDWLEAPLLAWAEDLRAEYAKLS